MPCPPKQCSHLQRRGGGQPAGADKIKAKREIEASPVGSSHITPGERRPFSGLQGSSTGPLSSPCPFQVPQTRGLGG